MKNNNIFETLKKRPSKKKRIVVTLDSDIVDFIEEQNVKYDINNLSYVYNELLRKALEGVI